VAPATIIDPETGQPLQAQAPAASAPASPAASTAPTTAPQHDDPQPPPDGDPIPLPPGLSQFDREVLTIFGATIRPLLRGGILRPEDLLRPQSKPPTADPPPT
jgi:hypothetical protein